MQIEKKNSLESYSDKRIPNLLAEIALKIRQSLELDYILNTAVAVVRDVLNVDRVIIYQFQSDGSGYVSVESVSSPTHSIIHEVLYDPCLKGSLAEAYKNGRVRAVADVHHDPNLKTCYTDLLDRFGVKSFIVTPILQGDNLWGLLIAHHCSVREWQHSEIELLQQLSVQMAIAIQQAELYQKLQLELNQRQRAQAELRTVNQKLEIKLQENKIYADIVKNMQVGLHVWQLEDPNDITTFRLKATNPAITQLTGYQEYEVIGKRISECFPHLLKTDIPEIYAEVIRSGQKRDLGEIEYIDNLNSSNLYAVKVFPLLNQSVGVLFENITERKRTQQQFQAQKLAMKMMTTMNADGIIIVDLDQVIQFINPAAALFFGRTEEELKGKYFDFPLEVGESTEINILRPSSKLKVEPGIAEMRIGTITWEGKDAYLASIRDMTERKRSETALIKMNKTIALEVKEREIAQKASQKANSKLKEWVKVLRNQNHEITLLNNMIDLLQACFTVEEACTVALKFIQQLFPKTSGVIHRINESKTLVESLTAWGDSKLSKDVFAFHECIALRRGEVHFVSDTIRGLTCEHLPFPTPTTTLCIPMNSQGEAIGSISFYFKEKTEITKGKRQLAVTVAKQFGLVLANLKLRETLKGQSIRDSLTGLYNRRYLEEYLSRETYRALRQQHSLGIMMIDIDHFKQFNDTYGHAAGDTVLKELGALLRQSLREYDIACRYGGEELIMILPETDILTCQKRAEEIRQRVKRLSVIYNSQVLQSISVSIGVACFPSHGLVGEQVIEVADEALYQAKAQGRDCTVVAQNHVSCSLETQ
ncbi:MAG: diguanylate cyclase [Microcoleaceae cyanobacterium]